jgi:hypothetical protein
MIDDRLMIDDNKKNRARGRSQTLSIIYRIATTKRVVLVAAYPAEDFVSRVSDHVCFCHDLNDENSSSPFTEHAGEHEKPKCSNLPLPESFTIDTGPIKSHILSTIT